MIKPTKNYSKWNVVIKFNFTVFIICIPYCDYTHDLHNNSSYQYLHKFLQILPGLLFFRATAERQGSKENSLTVARHVAAHSQV